MSSFLDKEFWNERYLNHQTGWDLGQVSPPLKYYFDSLINKDLKILIPGCGNAYEAEFLWKNGFRNVFLVDFAEEALHNFAERNPDFPINQLIHNDFFKLDGAYDLIIEQTFFCAIDPKLRKSYVKQMRRLLKPEGELVGLLFNRSFESGPPFGGSLKEYQELFDQSFKEVRFEDCHNSIAPRAGSELFFIAKK